MYGCCIVGQSEDNLAIFTGCQVIDNSMVCHDWHDVLPCYVSLRLTAFIYLFFYFLPLAFLSLQLNVSPALTGS